MRFSSLILLALTDLQTIANLQVEPYLAGTCAEAIPGLCAGWSQFVDAADACHSVCPGSTQKPQVWTGYTRGCLH